MIRRDITLLVALLCFSTSCTPLPPPPTPTAVVTNAPPTNTPTPVVSTGWIDRIKGCVSQESFLVHVLPELDQYEGSTSPVILFPVISLTATSRGCISLPEDLYPKAQREFTTEEGNASLGYVSNWEQACNSTRGGPLAANCTGDGYEGGGSGLVIVKAKSVVSNVPDLVFQFRILGPLPAPTSSATPASPAYPTLPPPNGLAFVSYPTPVPLRNPEVAFVHAAGSRFSWVYDVVDSTSRVWSHTPLALDSNGLPHIGYYDENRHSLMYAHSDGTNWYTETVVSGGVGPELSFALDIRSSMRQGNGFRRTIGSLPKRRQRRETDESSTLCCSHRAFGLRTGGPESHAGDDGRCSSRDASRSAGYARPGGGRI